MDFDPYAVEEPQVTPLWPRVLAALERIGWIHHELQVEQGHSASVPFTEGTANVHVTEQGSFLSVDAGWGHGLPGRRVWELLEVCNHYNTANYVPRLEVVIRDDDVSARCGHAAWMPSDITDEALTELVRASVRWVFEGLAHLDEEFPPA